MELLNCPFCDGEAEIERQGTARASMIIACTNCGCRVESGDVYGMTRPEDYHWNLRASGQELAALKHDVERSLATSTDLVGEMERLRDAVAKAFALGKSVGILEDRKLHCVDQEMRDRDYEPRIRQFYRELDVLLATHHVAPK